MIQIKMNKSIKIAKIIIARKLNKIKKYIKMT